MRVFEETPVPAPFDEIEIGQVVSLGEVRVDARALEAFISAFAPGWPQERGAPDAMVYALWTRLDSASTMNWPQTKRLGVDALRWARNPPAGESLRGRMTVMGKDPVGDPGHPEGLAHLLAQFRGFRRGDGDHVDPAGRLVFSCLTRSVFSR
jgi:hypothetical protein